MSNPSAAALERKSPTLVAFAFSNYPANVALLDSGTRSAEVIGTFVRDAHAQVIEFESAWPDFSMDPSDLAAAGDPPLQVRCRPESTSSSGSTRPPSIHPRARVHRDERLWTATCDAPAWPNQPQGASA